MSKSKTAVLKSVVLALIVGTGLAFVLYKGSEVFFSAKRKQTLVKNIELGQEGSGELVFPVGSQMPNISFKALSGTGGVYDLQKDKSALKIINFWASWCEPCVEEFSSFARLLKKTKEPVAFVGVSEDKTLKDAKDFLKAFSGDFKDLENVHFGFDDNKKHSLKYGLLALPESFIVDANNKLIRRVSGFERWDSKEAIDYFNHLIDEQKKKGH